jgi:hypothetical protein
MTGDGMTSLRIDDKMTVPSHSVMPRAAHVIPS